MIPKQIADTKPAFKIIIRVCLALLIPIALVAFMINVEKMTETIVSIVK